MADGWFIWPQARLLRRGMVPPTWHGTDALEAVFASYFPGVGHPVVLSSGRTGLVLALEALRVGRADRVGLFPFASHCVIEAVGRVGSPVSGPAAPDQRIRVLYHQWGYVQERADGACVEDAVDTFSLRGTPLFLAGADFEVWSLSKSMGTLGGGVLWCRDAAAALEARHRRDDRNGVRDLRWILRLLSQPFPSLVPLWYGAESAGGAPPWWGCTDIMAVLRHWDDFAEERHRRCELMKEYLVPWLTLTEGRLPTAIPVAATSEQGRALQRLGFTAGFRHIERLCADGVRRLLRVFPIPVHQDVPLPVLEKARLILAHS